MTIYELLIFISTFVSVMLSIYAFKLRKDKSAYILSVLMLLVSILTTASFFELWAGSLSYKVLWRNICQIGYLLAVPTLLVFASAYTGYERLFRRKVLALIYSFPVLFIVLVWTDGLHHLMRKGIYITGYQLIIEPSPLETVLKAMLLLYVVAAVTLLVFFYLKSNRLFKGQMIGILIGILLPFVLELCKTFRPELVKLLPPTSVAFTFSGIIIFWCIFKFRLFSIIPIARDKIIDHVQEGIITVSEKGTIIDKNNTVDRFIAGIVSKEINILGQNIDKLLNACPRWYHACKDMEADSFEVDTSVWGNKLYFYVKVNPIYNNRLVKRGTVSLIIDITERKLRENELVSMTEFTQDQLRYLAGDLSLKKKQLESIFDSMMEYCLVLDEKGNFLKVNKATRDVLPQINVRSIFDTLDVAQIFDMDGNRLGREQLPLFRAIRGERIKDYKIRIILGDRTRYLNLNATPVTDENQVFLFTVVVCHDITELMLHEEDINLKNRQLEAVFNIVSDMAYLSIADKNGKFVYYNEASRNRFSRYTKDPDQHTVFAYRKGLYYAEDGKELSFDELPLMRVLQGEKLSNYHFMLHEDNIDKHYLFSGAPVYDKENTVIYGISITIDITDQILHKRLIPVAEHLAELNTIKDKLFTIFTHDIRNPIATMVSLVELLDGDYLLDSDEFKDIIKTIKSQTSHTYSIIENLLDWLKSQREGLILHPVRLNIAQTVERIADYYQFSLKDKNMTLVNQVNAEAEILLDKDILELILRNIISNSIKFTGNGGLITVTSKEEEDNIVITVSDTGIGIPEENLKMLFTASQTRPTIGTAGEKGIGFGLLISKEFITRCGGSIRVESAEGVGSSFYLTFPRRGSM